MRPKQVVSLETFALRKRELLINQGFLYLLSDDLRILDIFQFQVNPAFFSHETYHNFGISVGQGKEELYESCRNEHLVSPVYLSNLLWAL